jgi:hypothetical protein
MRNISFAVVFFLVIGSLNAQNFGLGIKGGANLSTFLGGGGSSVSKGYVFRLAPNAGFFANFRVNDRLSIQPEIMYSSQGAARNGYQAFATSGYLKQYYLQQYNAVAPSHMYATYDTKLKLNYLSIPLLIKYGWDFHESSPLRLYVSGGPFISVLMRAHQVSTGYSKVYVDDNMQQPLTVTTGFNSDANIKGDIHKVNYGIQCSVGLSYKVNKNNFFVEGGSNYGFRNIQKDSENGRNNTYTSSLSVGVLHVFGEGL